MAKQKRAPSLANGKVSLRLPKSLHRLAALHAAREGVSLNQWLMSSIAAQIGAQVKAEEMAQQDDAPQ